MRTLSDCKDQIHSCSKCGLCQSVCPVYMITGNDCTVSKGHFIMLKGLINGELKISKTINKYLDLCLKCGACSKFCPSGIDVVDIVALAKSEYFKLSQKEQIKSFLLKLGLKLVKFKNKISPKKESKKCNKKVIYFGGCGGVNNNVIKLLNSMNIEVITPDFDCCGFPFYVMGDLESFKKYMASFYKILKENGNYDIAVNCATCEKTLKLFSKFGGSEVKIRNVFEYIRENNLSIELKKPVKVTYHKPCNLDNFDDVKYVLNNTKNLEYVEMKDYDKCCGMEGITNFKERKIMSKLFDEKHKNIKETGANTVLTSCLACIITLSLFSKGNYNVEDFIDFLAKNLI